MDKITLKALELAGYKDANTLAKIISYVPNPQVAAEMLLGVHTPREVKRGIQADYRKHKWDSRTDFVCVLSYDELGNTVKLRKANQKMQQVWYLTKEDKQNGVYVTERPRDYSDWGSVPVNGVNYEEVDYDIDVFDSEYTKQLSPADAMDIIDTWDERIRSPYIDGLSEVAAAID
jgi:hypothetical protein